jgi:Flp pilus assembly protein TadD
MTSALLAQGVAALRAGDFAAAERILLSVVERNVGAHQAWHALAVVAVRAGLPDIAVERARRAVELDRRNADYLNSLGIAQSENGDAAGAEQAFRRALKLKPAYAEAHYNLAKVLRERGELDAARVEYERAHALEPAAVPAQLGLAAIHRLLGRPERALETLRAGLRGGVDDDVIPYLSECLADVEGPEAALAWLRALLEREPGRRQAHHILGLLLLSLNRWSEGWPHFLWRAHWDAARMHTRPGVLPERLEGRRVFLRSEEGIGDILFYLRFVPELQARGASYAVECPPAMAKLAPLLDAVDEQRPSDLAIWIADLPALLQVERAAPPYRLDAHAGNAKERLARLGPAPYLALTWRAGTDVRRARELGAREAGLRLVYKEIGVEPLGAAVRGWRGTLVSLQRGLRPGELEALQRAAGAAVHDLSAMTEDLREALGLLAQLDEHVAVINTNMHLLAGLGRTARVLVPRPVDWRWTRAAPESPWFPGFRVYHQPAALDWSEPLARLRKELFDEEPLQ